jgi:hypothetical protein
MGTNRRPQALASLSPEKDSPMAQTKFSAGQRASVVARGSFGGPAGVVSIVSALPREAGPQQYRVKGEGENFERIVDEVRLEAVHYD